MENPLVSIIVPIFNMEKYLSECIESILKQSYRNIQIILVNDGSTDKSGEICNQFALHDKRIDVIHQYNTGPVVARQQGLKMAEGKYIGFVDADDYIEPCMYQVLVEELETTQADFVQSGYFEGDSKVTPERKVIDLSMYKEKFIKNLIMGVERDVTPSIWSKLFKSELIKRSFNQLSENLSLGEDLLNLYICIMECKKVALIDNTYYHYRIREGSLSHGNNIYDLYGVFRLYKGLCDIFNSYGYYKKLESTLNQFLIYMERISRYTFQIARYHFNEPHKLEEKKIVIYGAGSVGRDYYAQISRYTNCEIVAWVDSKPENYHYQYIKLYGIEILETLKFDILIIAVLKKNVVEEIYNQLIMRGIEKEKIYWSEPERCGMK